jgi:hypothetical protein
MIDVEQLQHDVRERWRACDARGALRLIHYPPETRGEAGMLVIALNAMHLRLCHTSYGKCGHLADMARASYARVGKKTVLTDVALCRPYLRVRFNFRDSQTDRIWEAFLNRAWADKTRRWTADTWPGWRLCKACFSAEVLIPRILQADAELIPDAPIWGQKQT